jgi:hypothetical protein
MSRQLWTDAEVQLVKALYPDTRTADIAQRLGRTLDKVYRKAAALGLAKSEAYLASMLACRLRRGDEVGKAHRFKPGQTAWNKGISFDSGGRSAETRFRKGTIPPNHRPVGSTRVTVDGYVEIKVAEGIFQWRLLHRENWKKAHGAYPARGTALIFKDGNKQNCDISNLQVLTRAELMDRNTVHNLPEEIKDVIRLNGVLRRKIHGK